MSTKSVVPDGTLVLTPRGPCLGAQLNPGDEVTLVDDAGSIANTEIQELTDATDLPLRRLLTASGEALLPRDARVVGSRGLLAVSELLDGDGVSVETLAPADVPSVATEACEPLDGVEERSFLLPRENGTVDAVAGQLEQMLERLGVEFDHGVSDRWLHVRITSSTTADHNWTWADELDFLRLLTAWEVEDQGGVISTRTRMDQPSLRQRLIAAHVATSEALSVSWLPGYHPVECRITTQDQPARAYAQVLRVIDEPGTARTVGLSQPGSLVLGPLLVRATNA